jgi:hypothetical protein
MTAPDRGKGASMAASGELETYLQDHQGGSAAGASLAKRLCEEHEGTPFGTVMAGILREIQADQQVLLDLVEQLGMDHSPVKQAAGWVAEKVSRLRLNTPTTGHSELSRMMQLDTLSLGIEGKRLMWAALRDAQVDDPHVRALDLDDLIARAEAQRRTIEPYRVEAAANAFRADQPPA